jgi:hypothetical protein
MTEVRCPTPQILDLVRSQLSEALRYTHARPDEVDRLFVMAIPNLGLARRQLGRERSDDSVPVKMIRLARIMANLEAGWLCMAAAPDVTDAAITLALWELGDLSSRLRKEEGAEERDRELMAAYGPRDDERRPEDDEED